MTRAVASKSALIEQIYESEREAQRKNPGWARTRPTSQNPEPITLARPKDGLTEAAKPFPSSLYLLEAPVWQQWRRGRLTQVYAGVLTQRRSQGIVIVYDRPYPLKISSVPKRDGSSSSASRSGLYLTPIRAGSVHIRSVRPPLVELETADGKRRLTFDLRTRKFRALR
jgi:hypothetical protein